MKLKLLYGLLLLCCLSVSAQKNNRLQAFEIKADTAAYITIPEANWQYLEETQQLTIGQVSGQGYDKAFKYNDALDKSYKNYWLRYRIKNTLNRDVKITIAEEASGQVYILAAGRWHHYKTGQEIPWSEKDGLKRINHIVYTIPAGEEILVYDYMKGYQYSYFEPGIGFKEGIVDAMYVDNEEETFDTQNSVFLGGFILFAALFNFLFYYIIREKLYLTYAIMLLLTVIGNADVFLFNLLFKETPNLYYNINCITGPAGFALYYIIAVQFLRMDKYYRRLFKIFVALSIGYGCIWSLSNLISLHRVFPGLFGPLTFTVNILSIVLVVSIITLTIVQWYKKRRSAQLFVLAILPFSIFSVINYTMPDNLPDWYNNAFSAALMWSIGVISWSLFERFRNVINDNIQQSLDKERILREKEAERNEMIAKQNELLELQVAQRTAELQHSLENLKLTQTQLIQSEKMASLGELTAGIAHEIQNPLNFVNNFSDVSIELLDEMTEEMQKGDIEEATFIATDIKQNLEKIAHHGRRADGIVKGMLQHSRTSSGHKEPTDISVLADEYLRLAYHGLRAKDKSFNADLVTNFGEGLPKVNIIPQDMGRVLLNLFTNAFYATQEKSKSQSQSQFLDYKPVIEVSTKLVDSTIEIIVKDNGTGIPDAIKDKILQPFFTTKPTGQGTGLGLSLSYDIVVKGHGGTIDIKSVEGQGSEFIIHLPCNKTE